MRDYDQKPRACHECDGDDAACERCGGDGFEPRMSRAEHRSRQTFRDWGDVLYQLRNQRLVLRRNPYSAVENLWYGAIRQRAVSPVNLP